MKFKLLIGILLLISIVVSACNSNNSRGYSGGNPAGYNPQPSGVYNPPPAKKCETVSVPHEIQEQIPYDIMGVPVMKNKLKGLDYIKEASVQLKNTDLAGTARGIDWNKFTVDFYFSTSKGRSDTVKIVLDVPPQETREFLADFDADIGENVEWKYVVTPQLKTRQEYRQETRCS